MSHYFKGKITKSLVFINYKIGSVLIPHYFKGKVAKSLVLINFKIGSTFMIHYFKGKITKKFCAHQLQNWECFHISLLQR